MASGSPTGRWWRRIPLPELLKRMRELPPEIEAQAARLRCTTLRYLNMAAGQPPADWHWIYVPETRYPFYRVDVFSTAMPSMAPAGCCRLRGAGRPRADLRRRRARHACGAGAAGAIATPSDVLFAEPQADRVRLRRLRRQLLRGDARILAFLEANGIYPRGRYGAWTYNAMEDCVLAGREVAALDRSRRRARERAA